MASAFNYNTNEWSDISTDGMNINDEFSLTYDIESEKLILFGRGPGDAHLSSSYNPQSDQWVDLNSEFSPHGYLSSTYIGIIDVTPPNVELNGIVNTIGTSQQTYNISWNSNDDTGIEEYYLCYSSDSLENITFGYT